ncbi:MAG: hypothetical protein M1820_004385 [Bogoriella megaspora]|nr:MAG: hypothetical protein M1820_004385 [Bogoriella megaspora]
MAEKHEYLLPRDFEESVRYVDEPIPRFSFLGASSIVKDQLLMKRLRLTAQHYLWTQHQGYHIHPSVGFPSSGDIQIADIACGNCLWLLDSRNSTTDAFQATWTGFDISDAQFPKEALLPSNVFLRTLDIYDVPSDLHGKFDLIHLRMLGFGVRDSDPIPVLRTLLALLKPGGWLQWDEADHEFDPPNAAPGTSNARMQELQKAIRTSVFKGAPAFGWTKNLLDSFRSAGFTAVVEDKHPIERTALKYWTELQLQAFASGLKVLAQNPAQDAVRREAAEKILEKFPAAIAEAKEGGAFCLWPKVVLGRKSPS